MDNLVSSIVNLPIQYIVLMGSFCMFIKKPVKPKLLIISILIVFLPAVFLYYLSPLIGIAYLFIGQLVLFLYNKRAITKPIYWILTIIVAICADHFATIICMSQLSIESTIFIFIRLVVFIVIDAILTFLLSVLLKKISHYITSKMMIVVTIFTLGTLIIFYINIYHFFQQSNLQSLQANAMLMTIYSIVLIVLVLLLVNINVNRYKLKLQTQENENFKNYVRAVEQINNDMQKFRHDYLNILLSMKGYITEKDWEGLERYFNSGVSKFEEKTLLNSKVLKSLNKLNDNALKGLMFNKYLYAIEQELCITVEATNDVSLPSIKNKINLIRVIGILMDNAIENSMENKKYKIEFAVLGQNEAVLFVFRNQIDKEKFNIHKVFEAAYTTKGDGHGIGLSTVQQILNREANLTMNYWQEDNWFNIELFVKGEST